MSGVCIHVLRAERSGANLDLCVAALARARAAALATELPHTCVVYKSVITARSVSLPKGIFSFLPTSML